MYRTDPPIVGCLHHDIFTYLTLRVVVFLKGIYGIEQIQLEGCPAQSFNLKVFWNFKKLAFFVFFSHDAIVCLNINKQLNWNLLEYTILCLQSCILSVYLTIYTNIQLSTIPKKYDHSILTSKHIERYTTDHHIN